MQETDSIEIMAQALVKSVTEVESENWSIYLLGPLTTNEPKAEMTSVVEAMMGDMSDWCCRWRFLKKLKSRLLRLLRLLSLSLSRALVMSQ